jgi:adenylosuccinate lyase
MVQRNAMKSWKEELSFFDLLKKDAEVVKYLPEAELRAIFDYQYYVRHVDEVFQRVGLK